VSRRKVFTVLAVLLAFAASVALMTWITLITESRSW
jgi:hypothetical protein